MSSNKRMLASYIKAVRNEISIDAEIYRVCEMDPSDLGCVPRPAKLLNKAKGRKTYFKFLVQILKVIWVLGGAAIFYAAELFRLSFKHNKTLSVISTSFTSISMVSSARSVDVIKAASLEVDNMTWLTVPWVGADCLHANDKKRNVFDFLNWSDFVKAYVLSVCSTYLMLRKPVTRPWVLQTYTAYRWYCVRLALSKIQYDHFLMADHFDRWAVLVDGLVSQRRLHANKVNVKKPKLTLVQHGELKSLEHSNDASKKLPFRLYYRLNAVNRICVFDEVSAEIFKGDVLSARCVDNGVVASFFNKVISLMPLTKGEKAELLFVGHPMCEEIQISILTQLRKKYEFIAYYKPHPTAGCGKAVCLQSWQVIRDNQLFPKVDLLVSYPSTLVREYSNAGVPAVLHQLQSDENQDASILSQIESELHRLAAEKR